MSIIRKYHNDKLQPNPEHCEEQPKPYTVHLLTFQHILRNQCSEDSCVCVGGGEGWGGWGGGGVGGGAIFGPLLEIRVLIAHRLKSAYMTVYVLVKWMWVGAWNSHSMFCI